MSHIAFGFSFMNRFGIAFGIRPLSNTGYDIVNKTFNVINDDTLTTMLYGSGNIIYAFTGLSIKILNLQKHKFAIGVNLGNVFGSTLNRQTVSLQNELIGSVKQKTLKINGFNPEFGFNYQFLINKSSNLSLSSIYKPTLEFNSELKKALITASDFKNENTFDTLDYTLINGKIVNPSSFEIGLKYDFTKYLNRSSLKIPQIILLASYKSTKWTEQNSTLLNIYLIDYKQFNAGVQFAPHVDFYDRSKSISFFSRVRYRLGYELAYLPWNLNSKQVKSTSYSVGFGFPITSQRTLSSLNFAITYGLRTNGNSEDFIEKNLGYSLGITISPAFYDRWFKKNKIE